MRGLDFWQGSLLAFSSNTCIYERNAQDAGA